MLGPAQRRRHGELGAAGDRFQLGGQRTLDVFGEVFNVTNHSNFATPSGDRRSTNFVTLRALRTGAQPATAQFGGRIAF